MAVTLAETERQNRRLNEQLATVQEEERTEIARDLHDEIGPFLFAVDVDAQTIPSLLARDATSDVAERALAIRQSVGHMQTHLRSVLSRLRPAMLLDLGLTHATDQLVAFWNARRPNIEFSVDVKEESFGAALDEVAYRIFQEGTSNSVRHGDPSHIALAATRTADNRFRITVRDDGTGLAKTTSRGFGLAGMRERVAILGGQLSVQENVGQTGVTLVAELPMKRDRRPAEPATNQEASVG